MDQTILKSNRDQLPRAKRSDFSNDLRPSSESLIIISSGSSDSDTCTEMGSPCESPESISEPEMGNFHNTCGIRESIPGSACSENGQAAGAVETVAIGSPVTINNDRLQTLFSEYERVIAGHTELRQGSNSLTDGSEASESSFSKLQQQPPVHDAATVYAPQRENPTRETRRRTQQKSKKTQRAAGTGSYRVKKKRVSAGRNGDYEFLRLGEARRASNGSIEYKVVWKPTWVAFEDLRGERALEEAEELAVHEFGQVIWERELRRSGHIDVDTETEELANQD